MMLFFLCTWRERKRKRKRKREGERKRQKQPLPLFLLVLWSNIFFLSFSLSLSSVLCFFFCVSLMTWTDREKNRAAVVISRIRETISRKKNRTGSIVQLNFKNNEPSINAFLKENPFAKNDQDNCFFVSVLFFLRPSLFSAHGSESTRARGRFDSGSE